MGTEGIMLRSLSKAANFVMKLHVAALLIIELDRECRVELFPAIDGLYACSENQEAMLAFIKHVLHRLSTTFILEEVPEHRFIVKAALSHGPIVRGSDTQECYQPGSRIYDDNSPYINRILLGMPLSQAHADEKKAAPFGLYIHESARVSTGSEHPTTPLPYTHYHWWTWRTPPEIDTAFLARLKRRLKDHYDWCEKHSTTILYSSDRIKVHRALMDEYFADIPDTTVGEVERHD